MSKRVLFALAFLVFTAAFFFLKDSGRVPGDTLYSYSPLAVHLLEGKGYRIFEEPYMRYPPGFPLFIAFFYKLTGQMDETNTAYRFGVIFLQSLTVLFLFATAREFFGARKALFAALLWLFHPVLILFTASLYAWNAASLLLFFFFSGMYFYAVALKQGKDQAFIPAGFLLGLSALVWPGTSYLWVVLAAAALFLRVPRPFFPVLLFSLFFLVPVVLWSWVVYKNTGIWSVSDNLYPSMYDGLTLCDSLGIGMKTVLRARQFLDLETGEQTGSILAFYISELRQHPFDLGSFFLIKAARAWYANISESGEMKVLFLQIPYLGLGLTGIFMALKKHRSTAIFLLAVIFYFWAVTVSVLAILRYMMPALGILFMFAGFAAEEMTGAVSARFQKGQNLNMFGPGKHIKRNDL